MSARYEPIARDTHAVPAKDGYADEVRCVQIVVEGRQSRLHDLCRDLSVVYSVRTLIRTYTSQGRIAVVLADREMERDVVLNFDTVWGGRVSVKSPWSAGTDSLC